MNSQSRNPGLYVYLLFVISWFLHITARIEILGAIRFDLLLVIALGGMAIAGAGISRGPASRTDKLLRILIVYSIVTIPFVEWPGSVIKFGFLALIKAIVFYYFTISFVRSEADLRKFIYVFIGCQIIRIAEPLYLHLSEGYWGSFASMEGWEYLERLSGSPYDIVNPNGLAFVVCTILPFLYFMARLSWIHRLAFIILVPMCVYVLALTGSRSGMIGLAVIAIGIVIKSRHRFALGACIVAAIALSFPLLSSDMQDRYLSVFGQGEKNAGTMDERLEGTKEQFNVALHRPFFGHGLGTSAEANANFTTSGPYVGWAMPAHNLYLEVAQELGFLGLVLFLLFMQSIYSGFVASQRLWRRRSDDRFLETIIDAMQVWLAMNIVFSFASFGLTGYEWYLFGGLSVIVRRLAKDDAARDSLQTDRSVFVGQPEGRV